MTTEQTAIPFGSVSWGTLRDQDLMTAFGEEFERLAGTPAWLELRHEWDIPAIWFDDDVDDFDGLSEDEWLTVSEFTNCLQDALQEFAPPYCYFGANEGDGSDFGWWPMIDAVEQAREDGELLVANDPGDVRPLRDDEDGDGWVYVNDHGNLTLYGRDGNVLWDCV